MRRPMSSRPASPKDVADTMDKYMKKSKTVPRSHPLVFGLALLSVIGSVIQGSFLSLFTTGELATDTILTYMGLSYLNVLALITPHLGIIESQPLWVWYILTLQWMGLGALYSKIMLQLLGKLNFSDMQKMKSSYIKSNLWVVFSLLLSAGIAYGLDWTLLKGAELMFLFSSNVLALPVAIFTPLLEFKAPVWVLVVLVWVVNLKWMKPLAK